MHNTKHLNFNTDNFIIHIIYYTMNTFVSESEMFIVLLHKKDIFL